MLYKRNEAVLVVIYDAVTKEILMLQRHDDIDFWQSVTGSLESGETPYQAAMREVLEETGIDILNQSLNLIDLNRQIYFEIFPQYRHRYAPDVTHVLEHWFALALTEKITPKLTEHSAYCWVSANQARQMTKSWNNAEAILASL